MENFIRMFLPFVILFAIIVIPIFMIVVGWRNRQSAFFMVIFILGIALCAMVALFLITTFLFSGIILAFAA